MPHERALPPSLATNPNIREGKLTDEHRRMAKKIAAHYAAAYHDYQQASWDDVGLRGESIKIWREAYGEGVRDMSNAILSSIDPRHTDELKALVERLFKEEMSQLALDEPRGLSAAEGPVGRRVDNNPPQIPTPIDPNGDEG